MKVTQIVSVPTPPAIPKIMNVFPYDFMGQCFAQCFESEAPSKLVRFLKRDWNVSVSDPPAKFEKLFMDRMTDETCMGDAVWENIDTIGENRVEWRCNTTCQLHNMCDQHHALEAYANDCEYKCRDSRGDHNCWQNCRHGVIKLYAKVPR